MESASNQPTEAGATSYPTIAATATALPPYTITREDVKVYMGRVFDIPERRLEAMMSIVDNAQVHKRHAIFPLDYTIEPRPLSQTNNEYIEHAVKLGREAAEKCLERAGLKPDEIDMIITVSCTGFMMFAAHGYLHSGVSIIHGVGLRPEHFEQMASHGVGLIWSPRSNIELYGVTTDVAAAKAAGVMMALAPDWSPSGSTGMLAELAYIDAMRTTHPQLVRFTDKELVEMATTSPARLARLDRLLGRLAEGYAAGLVVMRRHPGDDAYAALVKQRPTDVRLVIIAGQPVYGEVDLMKQLVPNQTLETIDVCGQPRMVNIQMGMPDFPSWTTTESRLQAALKALDMTLAPLIECSSK